MKTAGIAAPVTLAERIETLDVLRGVAICGILLMNIPAMGMIGMTARPPVPMTGWTPDWMAWAVQRVVFEGTMRGLFTLLFGAGMLLMLRRSEGPDGQIAPIDVWTRRCLILMGLGVVQFALFLWPGEILWTYGLTGLALLAFRTARVRTLLIAAAILLVGLAATEMMDARSQIDTARAAPAALAAKASGAVLTEAQEAAIDAREAARKEWHPTQAERAAERAERTAFPSVVAWSAGLWAEWNLGTDSWPWVAESLAFMLIGMALFRGGVLTGRARAATYRRMVWIGYGAGLALRLVLLALDAPTGFDHGGAVPDRMLLFAATTHQASRLLLTLGHVGLIVLLFRAGALGRATPLRALGRMALTVYSLESILTSLLFYGLGLVGAFGFAALMGIAAVVWIVCATFCMWWLQRHDMGPAEALLRAMAYGTFGRRRDQADQVLATAPPL